MKMKRSIVSALSLAFVIVLASDVVAQGKGKGSGGGNGKGNQSQGKSKHDDDLWDRDD